MRPDNNFKDPDSLEPKTNTVIWIASLFTVIWLVVLGNEIVLALRHGAALKAGFGFVLILGEVASYGYIIQRALKRDGAESSAHRIWNWALFIGAIFYLFGWKV